MDEGSNFKYRQVLADAVMLSKSKGDNARNRPVPDELIGIPKLPFVARRRVQHGCNPLARPDGLTCDCDVLMGRPERVLGGRAIANDFVNGQRKIVFQIGSNRTELLRSPP